MAHPCYPSNLTCYPLRLKGGEELKSTLLKFARDNNLSAPFIVMCCGSVTSVTLRMPSGDLKTVEGPFEISSLEGTLSGERGHLHISLADKDGNVTGGHVMEKLIIYTTAEVVIGNLSEAKFTREQDAKTGFQELVIAKK